MAKDKPVKEHCPKCNSTVFAVAQDKSNKHYCQAKGCGHVWVPGNEGMKRTDVVIKQLQIENQELKTELTKARAEIKSLAAQVEELTPATTKSEAEIFS